MSRPNHHRLPFILIAAALTVSAAALSGCVQTARAGGSSLYVKDAPIDDAKSVFVTFTRAQVLPENSSTWITVFEGKRTIDLRALNASDASAKLSDFDLQPGTYAKLRVAVSDVRIVFKNGTEEALHVKGNVVTVAEHFAVAKDGIIKLLVDFDLAKGIDIENGTYTPKVQKVRAVADDSNHDGKVDFNDTDEAQAGDGQNDQNGDNEPDQEQTDQDQLGDWNDAKRAENEHDESDAQSEDHQDAKDDESNKTSGARHNSTTGNQSSEGGDR